MAADSDAGALNGWKYFRLAERAARSGYWCMTLEDGKTFWSEGMYRLLGLEPGAREADMHWLFEQIRAEDVANLRERIAASIKTRAPFSYRTHAKDSFQVLDIQGEIGLDDEGRVIAVVGVCSDVTARAKAEAERELALARYRAMAEEASDIIVLHENGEAVSVSGALERLLNRTPEEMRRNLYLSLVHPDDLGEAMKVIGQPPPGAIWTATYRVRHADGHYVWFEVSTRGVYDETTGQFHREISVGRDVTERKRQELAMRAAQERAEAANRAKSDFLANMSHELRTPLNAIIGFSDIMRHHMLGSPDGGRYDEYAHLIHESAELLLGHITGILEMANIEGGKLVLEPESLALNSLLDGGLKRMQEAATRNGVTLALECADDIALTADKRAVEQILQQLLSNAIKFTSRGGHVCVRAGKAGPSIVLAVCDDGVGIPADQLPRLGRPFEQALLDPLVAKGTTGTGLGLALARSLVERHGGTLRIESTLGEGTTVTVEFPSEAQIRAA